MSDQFINDHMLDMFIFETDQLLEQLEACILDAEKTAPIPGTRSMRYSASCTH